MNGDYLGIDLGTSSVKLLLLKENGEHLISRAGYSRPLPFGWLSGIAEAARQLDLTLTKAIGLSSQVGTYVINGRDVLMWNESAAQEETKNICSSFSADLFIREISMPHPRINSYPIPRLTYIKKHWNKINSICQPKDFLCQHITNRYVTDMYSWRGLANTSTGAYSKFFLSELSLNEQVLPEIASSATTCIGTVTKAASASLNLPQGVPVYVGMNDFFSSILGMGVAAPGEGFDITGTSEHLGVICRSLQRDTPLVTGPYLSEYVHYGVTASSGAALSYGAKQFGFPEISVEQCLENNPPIFAPYLCGERAPIFDSRAAGAFIGITDKTQRQDMAYAVLEGVVFALRHIKDTLHTDICGYTVSGGAAGNALLNNLKAEILGAEVRTASEKDTSALGAAMVAAVGTGTFPDLSTAAKHLCKYGDSFQPTGLCFEKLEKRYDIFRQIYPATRNINHSFREVSK